MMQKLSTFLLAALLSACGGGGGGGGGGTTGGTTPLPPGTPQPTSFDRSVTVDGVTTPYSVQVPGSTIPAEGWPLVMALHGGGDNAGNFEALAQLKPKAATEGFVLVLPQGWESPTVGQNIRTWNAGTCCDPARANNIDHVELLGAVLDDVESLLEIDPKRVFVTGHSNGAMMAYRLGCAMADRIAAIAPNAGYVMSRTFDATGNQTGEPAPCNPSGPVAVLHMHGLGDTCTPFNGGIGTGVDKSWRAPVSDSIALWRQNNLCALGPFTTYTVGAATCRRYTTCRDNAEVELCTIDGGGHTWPGNPSQAPGPPNCSGAWSGDLVANNRLWDFFEAHPKP